MKKALFILLGCMAIAGNASAAMKTESVEYTSADGVVMEGFQIQNRMMQKTSRAASLLCMEPMILSSPSGS